MSLPDSASAPLEPKEKEIEKEWFVYCLSTVSSPVRTYIGATVDVDRRLRQHNGELKGGAKYTSGRPGQWQRVCYVKGFASSHDALSFEWHWKHFTRKNKDHDRLRALNDCLEWCKKDMIVLYE